MLLVWRLATYECLPGDRTTNGVLVTSGVWRQGVLCQVIDPETVGLEKAWRLAARVSPQAVWIVFSPGHA